MEVDWDLHAVVRGCCSSTTSTTTSSTSSATSTTAAAGAAAGAVFSWPENFIFSDPFQPRNDNSIEQFLNELNTPLQFQKVQKPPLSPQSSLPISPLSVLGGLQDQPLNNHIHLNHYGQHQLQHQQKQQPLLGKQQSFCVSRCTTPTAQSTRAKKRKNQMKRVCQVPAEGLSSDVWSWRKYGQKPIKGSPYPRGYYRCSTSKGCLARKQVERNRSDPDLFIITYTGEHNHAIPTHRNSLAGSTRSKPTISSDEDPTKTKPTSSPPVSSPTSLSPANEKAEDNDTDDDNFDIVMDEDFFEGLDELVSPVAGNKSPATPWLPTSVATTTFIVSDES